jgi:hypothetical protein
MAEFYICENCKRRLEDRPENTEAKRIEELHMLFGEFEPEDCVRVCDDCWKEFGFPEAAKQKFSDA